MYSKILIPVDGREGAWRAIKAATKAVSICDGEIVLLHVEPALSRLLSGERLKEVRESQREDALKRLKPVIDFLEGQHIPCSVQFASGTVASSIAQVAAEISADLIVMFTDGVDSVGDFFLGSTTQQVLESTDMDLLSVRQ